MSLCIVEITKQFTEAIQIDKFIIIGHSVGGLIGLLFAEKYPKKVLGFINIEGNLVSEDCFFSHMALNKTFDEFVKNIWPEIEL